MAEPLGYVLLVLHAHLPFVRHPEHARFLEEEWLYEAITETYIPLIDTFERLINEQVDFRITMSLTPTLISMLSDPLLQERYLRHINQLIELAHKEVERTR
jgi:1,4-alpha-glucan branching enzyme